MSAAPRKVLVLGVTGMLGHTLFRRLSLNDRLDVSGTARTPVNLGRWFEPEQVQKIVTGVDAGDFDTIVAAFAKVKPEIVINCIGIIKQLPEANEPLIALPVNALLPHRIAQLCAAAGARMVHISTDCVFDGKKGGYTEADPLDAADLYGRSKYLGEVTYSHCLTLRTSIIGHELKGKLALVEWFLSQEGAVRGYTKAIYSGFPTIELSEIIDAYVIPNPGLQGLYHLSSERIAKYDLLKLIAARYEKQIKIEPYAGVCEDRSLDSTRFRKAAGYRPPPWPELVERMYRHFLESSCYR